MAGEKHYLLAWPQRSEQICAKTLNMPDLAARFLITQRTALNLYRSNNRQHLGDLT